MQLGALPRPPLGDGSLPGGGGLASFWILGIWITQCTTLGNQCDLVLHLIILNVVLFSEHLLAHGLQEQFVSPRSLTYARYVTALSPCGWLELTQFAEQCVLTRLPFAPKCTLRNQMLRGEE